MEVRVKKYLRRKADGVLVNCTRCSPGWQPDDPELEAILATDEMQLDGTVDSEGAYTPPVTSEPDWLGDEYQGFYLQALTDIAWDQEQRLRGIPGAPQSSIGPLRQATTKAQYRTAVRGHVKNLVENN